MRQTSEQRGEWSGNRRDLPGHMKLCKVKGMRAAGAQKPRPKVKSCAAERRGFENTVCSRKSLGEGPEKCSWTWNEDLQPEAQHAHSFILNWGVKGRLVLRGSEGDLCT